MSSALSTKVSSILASSTADLDVRDALETLDARQLRNTPDTRRNLRLDVQREIIQCNGEIVQDFAQVAQQLRSVGDALANLQKTCAEMRSHIVAARAETAPVIDEADNLLAQKTQVETKQRILDAFTKHFQLDSHELDALTSSAEPIDSAFFAALVKAKRIHGDCQILLGSENQRLGREILEQSSRNLNAGFSRLHRWLQREFKNLSVDLDNPHIMNQDVRRALRVLSERPTLFQNCLDAFAEARERGLSDAFFAALTGDPRGGGDGLKPIEFSAHEPLRYVGDMLAWAHSTTVSEREALDGLFIADGDEIARGIQAGLESDPWSRSDSEERFDGRKALAQLVNRSLVGVAHLLRQRIEQVVHNHDEPVLAYRISNLIQFYRHVFSKLVDSSAGFMETLMTIENDALDRFKTTMRYHVGNVQSDPEVFTMPTDLSVPGFLEEALDELSALLKSYDSSTAAADADGDGLDIVFAEALDPFLTGCDQLAQNEPLPGSGVFAINCLLASKAPLSNFSFAAERVTDLSDAVDEHAAKLIAFQHHFFRSESGLEPLINVLEGLTGDDPQSVLPDAALTSVMENAAFKPEALIDTSHKLDDFLSSALLDAADNIKRLKDTELARDLTAEGAERFCRDFELLKDVLVRVDEIKVKALEESTEAGKENGDALEGTWLRECFPRTTEEIRILLS